MWLQKTYDFFHNSRQIRRIEQKRIYKKFGDMTRDWTQIACLAVEHFNHYTTGRGTVNSKSFMGKVLLRINQCPVIQILAKNLN